MTQTPATRTVPITRAVFGPEEAAIIQRPLETGWVVQGPFVREFEQRFAAFCDAPHAVATTSCTTALHLAVAALGLKPGDEVIVPAFTWIATANVVEYQGARPVFCDIDLATFNIDTTRIESLITERTVGIIPVHLFGLPADMTPIMEIAARHGLWVVEDAACSFGGRYHGRHTGTFGAAGCFSFHPRKSITTGEGGMLLTSDSALAERVRSMRDHGASRSDLARHAGKAAFLLSEFNLLGYNYRMTDIQGALGCAQMDRASWILEERAVRARRYDDLLAGLYWLRTPAVPAGSTHGWQAYVCLFAPDAPTMENRSDLNQRRNALLIAMEEAGVQTRQGTHAPVRLGFYRERYGLSEADYPNACLAEDLSVTLPLFPSMTDEDQDYVVDCLRRLHRG